MFKRSPCLTYLYGALDTTPPPPKERKERDVRATQATRVKDLVATKDTIMQEVCFRKSCKRFVLEITTSNCSL